MSLSRRHALVKLARKYDALIICDDVYDFLQWPVTTTPTTNLIPFIKPLPRLVDLDLPLGRSSHDPKDKHFGHVLSNGTFSKLIGPGVRTGWVEAAPDLAYGLSQTGSTRSGGAPSQLVAAMITQLLKSNAVDTHVTTKVQPALQRRHALMLQAIQSELSQSSVSVRSEGEIGGGVAGGYFVWLTLPDGMSGREISERAREEENLVVAEGEMFEVSGDERSPRFPRSLRLCFSWEEEQDVFEGVRRLGRVVRRIKEENGGGRVETSKGNGGNAGQWA
jgi:DNA-binding transcriptional MocR family regulator